MNEGQCNLQLTQDNAVVTIKAEFPQAVQAFMLIDNEVMEDEEFKLEQLKTKTPNAADVLASSKQHQLRKMTLTQFNLSSADWATTICMTYIESFKLKFSID